MHSEQGALVGRVRARVTEGAGLISANRAQLLHTRVGGATSRLSGLDQLGHAHGEALRGAVGSATRALDEIASYLVWVDALLEAIAATGECKEHEADLEQMLVRPAHELREFCFPAPTIIHRESLTALVDDLAATHFRASSEAAEAWLASATAAEDLGCLLDETATVLAGAETNECMHLVMNRVREGGLLARVYARNARLMAASVTTFGIIPASYLPQVVAARRSIDQLKDHVDHAAIESAYLLVFYESYTCDVVQALPPIRHLLLPAAVQAHQHTTMRLGAQGDVSSATALLEVHGITQPRPVGAAGAMFAPVSMMAS